MRRAPSTTVSLKALTLSLSFPLNVSVLAHVLLKWVTVISVLPGIFMIARVKVFTLIVL